MEKQERERRMQARLDRATELYREYKRLEAETFPTPLQMDVVEFIAHHMRISQGNAARLLLRVMRQEFGGEGEADAAGAEAIAMDPVIRACTHCGTPFSLTEDRTIYLWPDAKELCKRCNDARNWEDCTEVETTARVVWMVKHSSSEGR